MYEFSKLIFSICLLQKGPQDIPYSVLLFRFTVAIYALISFMILILSTNWWLALLQILIGILLTLVFTWLILSFTHKIARFNQTATALFGTDAMINFFAVPALASLAIGMRAELASLVLIGLMAWHLLVSGHIFRHALNTNLFFGLGIALIYILGSYWVMTTVFPQIVEVR